MDGHEKGSTALNGLAEFSGLQNIPLAGVGWALNQLGLGDELNNVVGGALGLAAHLPLEEAGQALASQPGPALLSQILGAEEVASGLDGLDVGAQLVDEVFMMKGLGMGAKALGSGAKALGTGLDLRVDAPGSLFPNINVDGLPPGAQVSHSGLGGLFDKRHPSDVLGWPAQTPDVPDWKAARFGEGPSADAVQVGGKDWGGMASDPRHHVFPQSERAWFEERGFSGERDIDHFMVQLPKAEHQALHGGGNWRGGRDLARQKADGSATGALAEELEAWSGEWNITTMDRLEQAEVALGRRMTPEEVQTTVGHVMDNFGVPSDFVPLRSE